MFEELLHIKEKTEFLPSEHIKLNDDSLLFEILIYIRGGEYSASYN